MAKINLLTIHWGISYGAVFQTYATCKILEELGHDVSVINIINPRSEPRRSLKYYLYLNFITKIQVLLFKRKYFPKLTKKIYNIEFGDLQPADYTIVGSDQVWNYDITSPIDKLFFLNFVKDQKKISLSSSFGKAEVSGSVNKNFIKSNLSEFSAISVREDSGAKICEDSFQVSAIQLIDPTLAYGNYEKLLKKKRIKEDYIYPFIFNKSKETDNILNTVSNNLSMKIYSENRVAMRFLASPVSWLNKIYNSSFVVTNSFHGLAFSLMFRKPFVVLNSDENKFTRLFSLLKLIGLEDRYIKSNDELMLKIDILSKKIDYERVIEVLLKEKAKYYQFCKKNII